jgi:hypothetical protein
MTPCGFLGVKAAEERDTFIFRAEGTFNMEVALNFQASVIMKIRVVTSRNIVNFVAAKFIEKIFRSGLDQD